MYLSRQKSCLISLLVLAACSDGTAPPQASTRLYVLESINGNPLPTITSAGAGDTVTVLWATLTLGSAGDAVTVDHVRHAYLAYPPQEQTFGSRYQYRVTGDSITVGFFGQCWDLCISNRVGAISESSVSLIDSYNPYPVPSIIRLYSLINTY